MRILLFLFVVLMVSFVIAAEEPDCNCDLGSNSCGSGFVCNYDNNCDVGIGTCTQSSGSQCDPASECCNTVGYYQEQGTHCDIIGSYVCGVEDSDIPGGVLQGSGCGNDVFWKYKYKTCNSVGQCVGSYSEWEFSFSQSCPSSSFCDAEITSCVSGSSIQEIECNNIDENCNGMVDDTLSVGQVCGETTNVGECSTGINECSGSSLTCVGDVYASDSDSCGDGIDTNCDGTDGFLETCDGIDNDCDGSVDEGLTGTDNLVNALGDCVAVETTCYDGNYGYDTELYSEPSTEEVCYDGIDNNCVGGIDEGCDFSLITDDYTGQVPSDNRYCTGSYGGYWIDDLNPAADTDFEDFTQYGQYKFACEAQGSFYWSGKKCCGSNTKFYYDTTETTGTNGSIILFKEYFADDLAGCFRGKPVPNDWTVGKAVNNEMYDDLLFFNSSFIGCDTEGKYSSLNVQYHPNNVLESDLVTEEVDSSAIRGNWACIGNEWRAFDDIPKIRIIAGALIKEVEDQDYYLFCDDENEYVVSDYTEAYSGLMQNGSCLMNILDSDVTAFGFGFEEYVDFQEIMELMGLDTSVCDNVDEGSDSDHKFFSKCSDGDLTVFIRKDFGVGVVANGDITPQDFFLVDMWKAFVGFIKGILSSLGFDVGGVTEYDVPLTGVITILGETGGKTPDNYNKFYSAKVGINNISAYSFKAEGLNDDGEYNYDVYATYGVLEDLCESAIQDCTYECGVARVEITSTYDARVLWQDLTSKTRLQEVGSYILGCTDSEASNYDVDATIDDCSCDYPTSGGPGEDVPDDFSQGGMGPS